MPRRKKCAPEVYSVGAVLDCCDKGFLAADRGEKFGDVA